MHSLKIESSSIVPKYRQVIDGIHQAIETKTLRQNQKIPSINELSQQYGLSRDTVLTAFNDLQSRGIIISKPGKGYYIAKATVSRQRKIFLLFDKLTSYKEVLYDAFKTQLKRQATVEIFFHNFHLKTFETLIQESLGKYTDYVIMPIPTKTVAGVIKQIPRDKLYILDRGRRLYGQTYPSVCQSFKKDIYQALHSSAVLLQKYHKLILLIPENSHIPTDLVRGFKQYCTENGWSHLTTKKLPTGNIEKGCVYLVLDDRGLVSLVQEANANGFQLGKDIGIISYNDTPLKSIVANGITTISTDFSMMGKNLADLILNKRKDHIENPSSLIRRSSL